MLVYTSVNNSYIPKARVLAKSVKKFHPDWHFVLLLSDTLPLNFDLEKEPFDEVLKIDQLNLPNFKSWVFSHAIVELCTAVKGPAAEFLAQRHDVKKIMYLDPDIKVFNSLTCLDEMLDESDILLTPHLLNMETHVDAIMDNEISALKHGVYNLGFFAAKTSAQGLEFIKWWSSRLYSFCRDDIPNGLFTDQRWCDLAPAFFSNLKIVRDLGCNVATWNIAHRPLTKDETGVYYVARVPLKFYHFTSYDNGNGFMMLEKYSSSKSIAYELWDGYGKDLKIEGQGSRELSDWIYGKYDDGNPISSQARNVYRDRPDIRARFPDPFSVSEPSYSEWWYRENGTIKRRCNVLVGPFSRLSTLAGKSYKKIQKEGLMSFLLLVWAKITK